MSDKRSLTRELKTLSLFLFLFAFLVATSRSVPAQSDAPTLSGQPGEIPESIINAVQNGNYVDAQDQLEKYIKEESGQPRGWYLLGYVRNRLSVHEDAYDALTVSRRLIGTTPEVLHRELGYAMAGQAQWAGALEHLSHVSDVTPKVRLTRGRCHLELGQYEQAVSVLEPFVNKQGEYAIRARFLRARAYASMEQQLRREDALAEIQAGLAMNGADRVHMSLRTILGVLDILDPQLSRYYLDLFTVDTVDWRRGRFVRQFQHEAFRQAIEKLSAGDPGAEGEGIVAMIDRIQQKAEGDAAKKLKNLSNFFERLKALALDETRTRTLVHICINPVLSGTNITTTSGDTGSNQAGGEASGAGSTPEQG